ncbi:mannose-1-phosphate guanylyltransferase [Candidatus Peregrinibacteria bacterium]|nr:mannose-1-phosphate guanylyltransferase [Candidatus Peregrinibacteria bacterium]
MKTVILAGGAGTRLWPMSRQKKPKQFQNLTGDVSMLIQTVKRLSFQNPEDIYIATNKEYRDLVLEQTKGLVPPENIIIEPALRDTAPCIGLIASILGKKNPDDVMAVIYADHLIQDIQELEKKLKIAEQLAKQKNTLNIIEVKALYPNVNLGYVKIGKQIEEIDGVVIHEFERFVEKPDLATAKQFLKSQSFLWNTGLFVWKVSTILEKYREFQPETFNLLEKISATYSEPSFESTLIEHYPNCTKISIDYGIMEKVAKDQVRIIPADLGWNDIGTWESIWGELNDENINHGNVLKGEVIHHETKNSLIYGHGKKVIATIGLEDFIVVDTEDALLVCPKSHSHQIKQLIEKIKNTNPELL